MQPVIRVLRMGQRDGVVVDRGLMTSLSGSANSEGRLLIIKSGIPPSGVIAASSTATAASSAATGVA